MAFNFIHNVIKKNTENTWVKERYINKANKITSNKGFLLILENKTEKDLVKQIGKENLKKF